ncbi:ComEA family DNA-binding protein [Paenibacillus hamazuiensis]|uniref:ComEA family DNA-binding protein n=1 Tax=Paenibacillus hamazuiensis TaxID=2936508 RepID=UPI00200FD0BB|nr:helix-hairpin-helix domain-containing protein [Paenibacillus hamazuiensis]
MVSISAKSVALSMGLLAAAAALIVYPLFTADSELTGWAPLNQEMQAMLEKQEKPGEEPASAPVKKDDSKPSAPGVGTKTPSSSETGKDAAKEDKPSTPAAGKIDINRASSAQLEELPGIGASKAKAIIAYREQSGPFRTPEDVMKVKGIGPKMYENIKDKITVEPASPAP